MFLTTFTSLPDFQSLIIAAFPQGEILSHINPLSIISAGMHLTHNYTLQHMLLILITVFLKANVFISTIYCGVVQVNILLA